MLTAIVVLLYIFVLLFDFVPVVKNGGKKEWLIYLIFVSLTFAVMILYSVDIKVPGPTDLIINSIKALFGV